jgi:hypothetical protein
MVDSNAKRQQRYRMHRNGDHSICKPANCLKAGDQKPTAMDKLEFGLAPEACNSEVDENLLHRRLKAILEEALLLQRDFLTAKAAFRNASDKPTAEDELRYAQTGVNLREHLQAYHLFDAYIAQKHRLLGYGVTWSDYGSEWWSQ